MSVVRVLTRATRARCGNVASILELDENLNQNYKTFDAATQENRGVPSKSPALEHYFL